MIEDLLHRDLHAMAVPDLDEKLKEAALEAGQFLKSCDDHVHAEEVLTSSEEGTTWNIMLFPPGRLVIRKYRENGGAVHGTMRAATVQALVDEGFELEDVVRGLYLFAEQGRMLAMGNMPPAEA